MSRNEIKRGEIYYITFAPSSAANSTVVGPALWLATT